MRALFIPVCLALACSAASAAELLGHFQPSPIQSAFGKTSMVEFSSPLAELESGVLAHHLPQAMRDFRFAEPVWIIGYKTGIVDPRGNAPRENYLCHTFFGDQRVVQKQNQEMKGIYSDAFTPEVLLPPGYGIPLAPDESLHWMSMFNNRGEEPVRVAMQVRLTLIRARDLARPLQPLYASLVSVQLPHLYFVPPGRDEKQVTFELPFDGKIHFLGTHIHPYGVSIELQNVSRNQPVWKGARQHAPDGPMTTFSSVEGYPVRAGETYRITAVYDNPTPAKIDAMAGMFLLYSRK